MRHAQKSTKRFGENPLAHPRERAGPFREEGLRTHDFYGHRGQAEDD